MSGSAGEPCWVPFTPREFADRAAERLAAVRVPWAVAGGWAVDLALGRVSRAHEDLEVAIPADAFRALREALFEFTFVVPFPDGLRAVDDPSAMTSAHQTWARDSEGRFRFDVLREPHDGDVWIYRRDPALRRPYADVVHVGGGIPYLAPEIVLLFKAKHVRPKDEADLEHVLPHLAPAARAWLAEALARVHPGHPWLPRLDASPARPATTSSPS